MKSFIICIVFICIGAIETYAKCQDDNLSAIVSALESKCESLRLEQEQLGFKVKALLRQDANYKRQIFQLQEGSAGQQALMDSLQKKIADLSTIQLDDRAAFSEQIEKTNANLLVNEVSLMQRTLWGSVAGLVILTVFGIAFYLLSKKIKKGSSSITEVRKAQEALCIAQTKIQEESVKLDSKLLEMVEKQIVAISAPMISGSVEQDHSLTLKVADEIVRIEMNLSRMDASVKGYRQLVKAVLHIKDNFLANGYEIVDMLGKPYNAGMKVIANFVVDENLGQGQQVITGIIKPQINFNGKMIQSAQITVSQNI